MQEQGMCSTSRPVLDAPLQARSVSLVLPEPVGPVTLYEDPAGAGPGGAVWDASVALAQHIAGLGAALAGARVLELGAGTGLPGLAAAKLGAHVVLTDRARALPLLRRNAAANDLASVVAVQELEWGRAGLHSLGGSFQLVLAADVVAHEESFEPLLETLLHVARAGAEVLIANKCRDVSEHCFWAQAAEALNVELLRSGLSDVNRDGDELPILLYRLWSKHT